MEVGDEIRITCDLRGTGDYEEHDARVVAIADSSITVGGNFSGAGAAGQFIIPADRVRQIDKKRINRGTGAAIGLGVGAGAGVLIALVAYRACDEADSDHCSALAVGTLAVLGGVGAGIGAGVGRSEQVETFLAPGARIALAPILTKQRKGLLFTIEW